MRSPPWSALPPALTAAWHRLRATVVLGRQIAFDVYLGIIVLVSMVSYMGVTIWITEWRTRFRRESNEADNDARQKGTPLSLPCSGRADRPRYNFPAYSFH